MLLTCGCPEAGSEAFVDAREQLGTARDGGHLVDRYLLRGRTMNCLVMTSWANPQAPRADR